MKQENMIIICKLSRTHVRAYIDKYKIEEGHVSFPTKWFS